MESIILYVGLFCIIVIIGQLFNKFPIPLSLLLVVAGMLLSLIPNLGSISIHPSIVLNIFLPLLVYQISSFSSWKDFKRMFSAIALLSVGHVFFITILVAVVIHFLIPALGWALSFVIGAILSPPDDVAIVSIAEKIRLPERVITILEGEGMLNDATALILFRFSLAAIVSHHFSPLPAVSQFFLVVVCETLYGVSLGFILGELRKRISNPSLHVLASLLTPFIAYLPPELLGGSGIIATVATGLIIGNVYAARFTPEFRLISRAMWPSIFFGIQSILFLLVGLKMFAIVKSVSMIPVDYLLLYSGAVIATIIIGRFFWVYFPNFYIPRILFPALRRRDPHVPWQFPFVVSWAGMRGSISLAAALAVPFLPTYVYGANSRDLLIFLVFTVILATLLLQGFSLPWVLKLIGIEKFSRCEQYTEHVAELTAKKEMAKAALNWLKEYKEKFKNDERIRDEIEFQITHYKMVKSKLKERIVSHDGDTKHDEAAEIAEDTSLLLDLIDIEKNKLMDLWHNEKINLKVRNKLLEQLDHQARNLKA